MIKTNSVAFYTLGCKLNFSETSTIARDFTSEGFERVDFSKPAQIYVINTCSVTDNADKRFKTIVKQALKINPEAFIIAIGCYAQLKPEELADVNGVDLVLGATEKFKITHYINELTKKERAEVHSCEIEEADFYVGSYSIGDRTRAFLKVQDGCDYKCTFCTIPLARGLSRSAPLKQVLEDAHSIASQGIQEIVLTGVNIGDYGKGEFGNKRHENTFLELVQALDKVDGINRLRISSIEPNLLKNETIQFVASSRTFVPHFHVPLQSGSNDLLKVMKRRYNRELYEDRVHEIKRLMPDACIGVDVIVGFPGETDEMFLETYEFLNELDISYLHVFTYSERANTPAAGMPDSVPHAVRAKRSKLLRGLSVKKRRFFYERQIGTIRTVLFEGENKSGYIHGFTENYVKVKAPWNPGLINTLQRVKLTSIDADGLVRFKAMAQVENLELQNK
ncbi:MAG: tRNA (N(6)-L-threonylcarbamoyladenosine(37)-C(2))-methylthiotransferase MtaB [Flavobacteriaceae bacterium]|nr:tRNA (N(6)-L-threonylcarbamoyladenosine(37)-C(2))-methylthiotransferase MtaB [Flavobacteriaceae bacterium]